MGMLKLEVYLNNIGASYDELVSAGVIPSGELEEIYEGSFTVGYEPESGVDLEFWAETRTFEVLHFTLAPTIPLLPVFEGKMDEPYGSCTTREKVLSVFGAPSDSKGPFKMPLPMGEVGGWDKFDLGALGYSNLNVLFKYDIAMRVSGISFSLKETRFDRMLANRNS
ncbi:hypothetical protein [Pseudomonas sp. Kh13]|uniref:DUF6392 family protein n=1 Tax=Pseudomonas sp. Kh13 TaxID=2093744 RepID=UPI00118264D9|nr:hypothetical protein [Pseudomonas sp. Kh13]